MTLTYEFDLDILKMYLLYVPKMKFLGQGFRKLDRDQDRHTHRPNALPLPHSHVVIIQAFARRTMSAIGLEAPAGARYEALVKY